jgi:hypothetical protein
VIARIAVLQYCVAVGSYFPRKTDVVTGLAVNEQFCPSRFSKSCLDRKKYRTISKLSSLFLVVVP